MKKTQILILFLCLLGCCGVLFSLYALSPISKEIFRADFNRNFLGKSAVGQQNIIDINFNSFYLAGTTSDKIYLGNYTAPAHLLVTDYALKDTSHIRLEITGLDSINEPNRFRLSVIPGYFFMSHGTFPIILRGQIDEWKASPFMTDEGYFFADAEPISKATFALKSYHTIEKSYELALKTVDSLEFKTSLLNKQIDGLFCVDGKILFDEESGSLAYVHFYRNELIVCDSNLNLKYRSHTIDTFSRARIRVSKVNADGTKSMLSAPPMHLNRLSYAAEGKLYINSNVLAANEVTENFMNDTVIDVYDLNDHCAYLYSFYIPSKDGHKASSFVVKNNTIIAVQDRYLITYKLTSNSI